jgi:cytochrome c553
MKRTPISMRLAATLMAAVLAGCGGAGDAGPTPAAGLPAEDTGTVPVSAPAAPATPDPGGSPAPAPAPSAGAAPAPASEIAGDALRGKQLYADLPNTTLACEGCHGPAIDNVSNILSAAGDWTVIARAIAAGRGGMDALAFPVLTGYDLQDIAAYLAQPTL